jgi:hypothetical protein
MTESGMMSVEVVARYEDKESVGIIDLIEFEVSIEENETENIKVYPNPAEDFVELSALSGQLSAVKIYNCLGMMVEKIEVNADEVEIKVTDYKPGVYFINIETNNSSVTKKIIVR